MCVVRELGRARLVAVALTLLPAIGACHSSSGPPMVSIRGFAFHPRRLVVHAGQVVTVGNQDAVLHGFTADDRGSFDLHSITAGSSARVTLSNPGIYHYHCPIHVSMTGVVEVSR